MSRLRLKKGDSAIVFRADGKMFADLHIPDDELCNPGATFCAAIMIAWEQEDLREQIIQHFNARVEAHNESEARRISEADQHGQH